MSVAVSQTRLRASACAGQGPGAAPPAGQARLPGLRAVRQEHPATRADPSQDQCLRGAARTFAHEQGRRLARNDCKDQQNSPVLPREAVERQSSAAVTAANAADHQSRDPFGCMHLTPDKLQNSQA